MKRGVVFVFTVLLLAPPGRAQELSIETLLERVSRAMGGSVAFREEHHSELYSAPVEYTGRLEYHPGERSLVKDVQTPEPARLEIGDRYLTVHTTDVRRRFSLRGHPQLLALARGFLALAEGDHVALGGSFAIELLTAGEGNDSGPWELLLIPSDPRVAEEVDSVVIHGRKDRVLNIRTNLSNGDWQRMELLADD